MTGKMSSKNTEKVSRNSFYGKWKRELFITTVAVLSYVLYIILTPKQSPIIQTTSGKVQGTIGTSRIGRPYYEYVGIPYVSE